MKILGIESSCDECSVSWLEYTDSRLTTRSLSTFSQIELHRPFGGVVPEVAARNHVETILPMLADALREAGSPGVPDAIAVTNRPGLVGALLVGVCTAKALALAWGSKLVPVHHLDGHLASLFIEQEIPADAFPMVALVVSGGHTHLYLLKEHPARVSQGALRGTLLGGSRDDAAGEAFDKTAKLLGFPYPGGHHIDRAARGARADRFVLPRPQSTQLGEFEFSFSGLKTAAMQLIRKLESHHELEKAKPDLCASIQEAILDQLLSKTFRAVTVYGAKSIGIVGGVSANSRLRERLAQEASRPGGVPYFFPHLRYCTDNAAMIAAAGAFRLAEDGLLPHSPEALMLTALPHGDVERPR